MKCIICNDNINYTKLSTIHLESYYNDVSHHDQQTYPECDHDFTQYKATNVNISFLASNLKDILYKYYFELMDDKTKYKLVNEVTQVVRSTDLRPVLVGIIWDVANTYVSIEIVTSNDLDHSIIEVFNSKLQWHWRKNSLAP